MALTLTEVKRQAKIGLDVPAPRKDLPYYKNVQIINSYEETADILFNAQGVTDRVRISTENWINGLRERYL